MMAVFFYGGLLGLFVLGAALERWLLARMHHRPVPFAPWQPLADGLKLLTKEAASPAPLLLGGTVLLLAALLPYGSEWAPAKGSASLVLFFAVAVGGNLGLLPSHPSALARRFSYQAPLLLLSISAVLAAGSLSLTGIVEAQVRWFLFTPWGAFGAGLFFLGALVDFPEGEAFGGVRALWGLARQAERFAYLGLLTALFLGGGRAPVAWLVWVPEPLWFVGKTGALGLLAIWVRASTPRLREDQRRLLAWNFLLPMSFCTLISAALGGTLGGTWGSVLVVAVPFCGLLWRVKKRFGVRARRCYYPDPA